MTLHGIPISNGVAFGPAVVYRVQTPPLSCTKQALSSQEIDTEVLRLTRAVNDAEAQLTGLMAKSMELHREDEAAILKAQKMVLHDPEFVGATEKSIRADKISAACAVSAVAAETAALFAEMDDDPYLKERAADIEDIGRRLLRNLSGTDGQNRLSSLPDNSVVIAEMLGPSDTVQLDREHTAAIVTEQGGKTSHSAILARNMGLAAVAGIPGVAAQVHDGDTVIVDGTAGILIVQPTPDELSNYKAKKAAYEQKQAQLKSAAHIPCTARNGKKIVLAANIGSLADLDAAVENGADAVGLFRTEFLYLDRTSVPGEEEQFTIYKTAAEKMGGKPVIIRTLDIGGDKDVPYLKLPREDNPFLGMRAIRLCFTRPELFKTQLRAVLRASVYGDLRIMFPMIGSVGEIQAAKKMLRECEEDLAGRHIAYKKNIPVGSMIEIPAAALIASDLAKECNFFSIGTNDLVQYTLAVDRTNQTISSLYDPFHPAVLSLIRKTIHDAHEAGIECGMCGEFAGNPQAVPVLLGYGLDEFSVSASLLLETRDTIVHADIQD